METHTRPAARGQRVPPREGPHQPVRVNVGAATRRLRTRFYTFPERIPEQLHTPTPRNPQPFGPYQILRRQDGYAIGGMGFRGAADENGSVTIGYGLIPSARGKGYASEALRGLLLFARAHGIACVEGDTTHDNTASQHVMTAVGMRLVAEDERLK